MTIPNNLALPTSGSREIACLLRKDLGVFIPRDRILVFGIFFLASLQAVFHEEAFFWLGVMLAGALATYIPVIEWNQETDPMLHSLPVRRVTVVLARYMSSLVAGLFAGVAWISVGSLLRPLLNPGQATPAMWMTLDGILTFLVASCRMMALFLPLDFKLGLGRGLTVFFPLSLILFAGLFMLTGVGSGREGGLAGSGGIPLGIPRPSSLIRTGISDMVAAMGPVGAVSVVLLGLAAALSFSAWLSTHSLQRRDI